LIKYSQIITAVNSKLKAKFPLITIQAADDGEGLTRPSFRTSDDNTSPSNFMNVSKDTEMTIRVYFFPTNKVSYRIEILDMQNDLENLFLDDNTLVIDAGKGQVIEIQDVTFDVVDGVLHFYFDISFSENFEKTDTGELMETLELAEKL
jgi:hypothetical protein